MFPILRPVSALNIQFNTEADVSPFLASLSLRHSDQYRGWCVPILWPVPALDIQFYSEANVSPFCGYNFSKVSRQCVSCQSCKFSKISRWYMHFDLQLSFSALCVMTYKVMTIGVKSYKLSKSSRKQASWALRFLESILVLLVKRNSLILYSYFHRMCMFLLLVSVPTRSANYQNLESHFWDYTYS